MSFLPDIRRRGVLAVLACQFLTVLAMLSMAASARGDPITPSPIDIVKANVVRATLPALNFTYSANTSLSVINTGSPDEEKTVRADVPVGMGSVTVGGVTSNLLQFHWHIPSEHTVNGIATAMEMHLVHQGPGGVLTVVGVFLEEGAFNSELDKIFSALPPTDLSPPLLVPSFNLQELLPEDLGSYRYTGSLTTPPFSEPVNWIVLGQPLELSAAQIAQFEALFPHENIRHVQDLNGRVVLSDIDVPEPATLSLIVVGGLALLGSRWRRRRHAA